MECKVDIRKRINQAVKWAGVALAALLIGWVVLDPISNEPVSVATTTYGVVTSYEYNQAIKNSTQPSPSLWVRLDTGQTILLNQTLPFDVSVGQRLRITTWKRRLFGYRTTYEPA